MKHSGTRMWRPDNAHPFGFAFGFAFVPLLKRRQFRRGGARQILLFKHLLDCRTFGRVLRCACGLVVRC